jgi:hypothetical protein
MLERIVRGLCTCAMEVLAGYLVHSASRSCALHVRSKSRLRHMHVCSQREAGKPRDSSEWKRYTTPAQQVYRPDRPCPIRPSSSAAPQSGWFSALPQQAQLCISPDAWTHHGQLHVSPGVQCCHADADPHWGRYVSGQALRIRLVECCKVLLVLREVDGDMHH